MPIMQKVPVDHPLMKAWEKYRAGDDFRNSFKHAADLEHRTGSMWAAFEAGFLAAAPHPDMTDIECIEYAVQVVLLKCREANPSLMQIPPAGSTVMEWFADALREAKQVHGAGTRKAHKVMTADEYAAVRIVGWHEVCRDVDGFGGVGIRYITDGR